MKSMTGFAWKSLKLTSSQYDLSIKVVNGRFLEMRFHVPKDFNSIEPTLRKLIQKCFVRGSVDIRIQRPASAQNKRTQLTTNIPLAKQWLKLSRDLNKQLKLPAKNLNIEFLLRSAGVIETNEVSQATDADLKKLTKNFLICLKDCDRERQREGKSTAKQILKQIATLLKLITSMEAQRKEANALLMSRMKKRLDQFSLDLGVNEQRLSQEIAYQLERADIAEEIMRLKEHIKACQTFVSHKGPHGKKLDFFSQELLREINTIGSKSQVTALTQLVVDAKVIIEQFREQVQNIE